MDDKNELNDVLLQWIFATLKDIIKNAVEEETSKFNNLISASNMINHLSFDVKQEDITNFIGEKLISNIFEEIKNII